MHIAFDGGDEEFARAFGDGIFELFGLHRRGEHRDALFHHAGGLHHLWEEHFTFAEEIPDDFHAVHERAFDDFERHAVFDERFLGVRDDEIGNAFEQRMLQTLLDAGFTPREIGFGTLGSGDAFELLRKFDERLGGTGMAIEEHVFHLGEELLRDVLIHFEHPGIHDAHVHAGFDGVEEEGAVHGLTHLVVAAEAEADVAHAAADFGTGEVFFDPAGRVDEVERVVVVLLHAGGDGEDVRIKDDVLRIEAHFIDENAVGAFANADLVLVGRGLAFFVKGHHHGGGTVAFDAACTLAEGLFAFLHRDGVRDALALQHLQSGLDDFPLRRIDHDGHFRHLRLGLQEREELRHHVHAVDEAFVHAHVDDVGSIFDLLTCDADGLLQLAFFDELGEFRRASHVRALADHEVVRELRVIVGHRARQTHDRLWCRHMTRLDSLHSLGDGFDVSGRVAAAAAHDVHKARFGEIRRELGHVMRQQVKARRCQRIRQTRIRIRGDEATRFRRELLDIRPHFIRTRRAVHADAQWLHMHHRIEISLHVLRGNQRAALHHRGGDLHRQLDLVLLKHFLNGKQRRLRIQRIEDRLHEQRVAPPRDQGADLVHVSLLHLIKGDWAKRRIISIHLEVQRHRHRPDGTSHVALHARVIRHAIRPLPALLCRHEIDVPRDLIDVGVFDHALVELRVLPPTVVTRVFDEQIALRHGGRPEGIRLDDVCPGLQEAAVNVLNDLRLRDAQDVAVVEQVLFVLGKASAASRCLVEHTLGFIFADGRAHGTIDHEDALAHGGFEFGAAVGTGGHGRN